MPSKKQPVSTTPATDTTPPAKPAHTKKVTAPTTPAATQTPPAKPAKPTTPATAQTSPTKPAKPTTPATAQTSPTKPTTPAATQTPPTKPATQAIPTTPATQPATQAIPTTPATKRAGARKAAKSKTPPKVHKPITIPGLLDATSKTKPWQATPNAAKLQAALSKIKPLLQKPYLRGAGALAIPLALYALLDESDTPQAPQTPQSPQPFQPSQAIETPQLPQTPQVLTFPQASPEDDYYGTAFTNMGLSPETRAKAIQARLGDTATRRPGIYDVSPDTRNRIYKQVDKSGRVTYTGVGMPEPQEAVPTMGEYIRELMTSPYTTPEQAVSLMQALGGVEAQRASNEGASSRQAESLAAADRRLDKTLQSKEKAIVANMIMQDIQRLQETLLTGRLPGPIPQPLSQEQRNALQEDLAARMAMLNKLLYNEEDETVGYAEGGQVAPNAAIDPIAEGKHAGLESGDYVFPAEAVRYYGVKMLKDMVQKALVAE